VTMHVYGECRRKYDCENDCLFPRVESVGCCYRRIPGLDLCYENNHRMHGAGSPAEFHSTPSVKSSIACNIGSKFLTRRGEAMHTVIALTKSNLNDVKSMSDSSLFKLAAFILKVRT